MLVPVLRLPPRVVCLDHNDDGVHGVEFHGLPPLGGGRLLGDPPDHGGHFGGHPLEGDPPISQANYLCLTKRRLFKTQQFKSHFDQDQHRSRGHFCPETKNSILATFHLFPLKKTIFLRAIKINVRYINSFFFKSQLSYATKVSCHNLKLFQIFVVVSI